MKYKTKNVLKKVLSIGLACVIGVGAIAGISALANKSDDDGKVKINPSYSIGGLDENGKYVESDATLYTKDAFECQGLTIKPDFDSNVKYEIFFYDEVGQFIESTGVLSTVYDEEVPLGSSRARLELTPVWGEDVKAKDQVIKWYNKYQFESSLDIKVNEEQVEYNTIKYSVHATSAAFIFAEKNNPGMTFEEPSGYEGFDVLKFDVSTVECFTILTQEEHGDLAYIFVDANNVVLYKGTYSKAIASKVDVISNATTCYLSVEQGVDYLIYK